MPTDLREAFNRTSYTLLQSVCTVIVAFFVIHTFFDFSWQRALTLSVATVGGYWLGQGVLSLLERWRRPTTSLD